ncbi:hypothetical protein B0H14DRAFT_3895622 [Mycena olivaceomarginata]|nr:hypothetical protein B0H14DRAFT_3895622 [Mycena olivaceomarginata]
MGPVLAGSQPPLKMGTGGVSVRGQVGASAERVGVASRFGGRKCEQNADSYHSPTLVFVPDDMYVPWSTSEAAKTSTRALYAPSRHKSRILDTAVESLDAIADMDGAARIFAVYSVGLMMTMAQDTQGSVDVNIMEIYLKGVIEYSGTVLRTCLSANGEIVGQVDAVDFANMSLPMGGMYHTQTMGWAYSSGATRWVLVPGTLIALSYLQHRKRAQCADLLQNGTLGREMGLEKMPGLRGIAGN